MFTATACLTAVLCGCGGGTIVFPGDDDDDDSEARVTFTGNLDSVSPVTTNDIVVFVYEIDDDSDRCPCPLDPLDPNNQPNPSYPLDGKAVVLSEGETEFTVSDLDPGAFGVILLLDNAGDNADGEINPGDRVAILDDVDCELDDIEGRRTVTLEDIDVVFSANPTDQCQEGDPPVAGRARADRITQKTTTNADN